MIRSLAIAAAMLLVAQRADAVPRNTVKAHIDMGTKAHKEGKFDVALEELKAAYALDPKPDLLFAIAQIYNKLDKCSEAVAYYEKFLGTQKDPQTRQVVQQAIDACKAKAEPKVEPKVEQPKVEQPKVEPKVEQPKVEPKIVEPKTNPGIERSDDPTFAKGRSEKPRGPAPWYKDPIGDVLVVGGVAAGIGGFVMWRGANSNIDKANASTDINTFRDLEDKASRGRLLSVMLAGGSVALVTVGVIRYRAHGKKERARVVLAPTTDGGLVTMNGRF